MSILRRMLVLSMLLQMFCAPTALALETLADAHGGADFPPLTFSLPRSDSGTEVERIHPAIRLLDHDGEPVLESMGPLSLMKTCGRCHDTDYIETNNYHAQVGIDEMYPPGAGESGRAWDTSPGMFGRWNPLTYRVLSPRGVDRLDMGTADWIISMGPRHVGGGPAALSRYTREPLAELVAGENIDPETHIIDGETGEPRPWNWKASGGVELNCLLCHMKEPNNIARIAEIKAGRFRWASTATALGSGLVEAAGGGYKWQPGAFNADGSVSARILAISDPRSANCRVCHAKSCRCVDPVIFENSLENWAAETTGEVFSPGRLFDSGMNLENKSSLSRAWDVHSQRLFECVNCHYSMGNPKYNEKEAAATRPDHLRFDARRLSDNDYLLRPNHNLAKGHSPQGTVARRFDGSMRSCRDCHDAMAAHDFLPYKSVHFASLSCQTCHVPHIFAPARRVTDWTVITRDGSPLVEHRGVRGPVNDPASLIHGYPPALLLHEEADGGYRLGPYNLTVSWFWVEGNPERPVRLVDLKAAFLKMDGGYQPDILTAFDADGDGTLSGPELRLDSEKDVAIVAARLAAVGARNPHIRGEIQPYMHSHGVAAGDFVLKDCRVCHSQQSRINREIELAAYVPGGVMPEMVKGVHTRMVGALRTSEDGTLVFKPALDPGKLYIHGTLRPQWLDIIGIIIVLGSLGGVLLHGGLRIITSMRHNGGDSS